MRFAIETLRQGGGWLLLVPAVAGIAAGQEPVTQPAESPETRPAATQPAPTTQPVSEAVFNLWRSRYLTGDWLGARTALEQAGINFQLTYHQQFQTNIHGGLEAENGFGASGSYELSLDTDFEKLGLVPGGSFFMMAKGTWSTWPTTFDQEKIGGLSRTNNDVSWDKAIFVDKWWWRQRLLGDRLELRLGRIQSEKLLFDVSEIAGSEDRQFMNSFLVQNPTIPHRKTIAAYLVARPTDWLYLQGAALDAQGRPTKTGFETAFHGDDLFIALGEAGLKPAWESPWGTLPGHYRFGVWHAPLTREIFFDDMGGRFAKRLKTGDTGFYLGFDQLIWRESREAKDRQGLSLFARYGYAHEDVNRVEHFWSAGAQYVGPIPTRDQDVLGFGVAQAILSDRLRSELNPLADRETVYELYYAIQITPWLVITPDIQFVRNPGGNADHHDAVVANVRVRIVF
jgi:porin